jgi:glycosyltransferase involved in cell wall biosynthesis
VVPFRDEPAEPTRAARPRRLALLKPEFGVTGGFEGVADWIEATLRRDGHEVDRLTVGVDTLPHRPFGLPVPDHVWHRAPEYFRYIASTEAFERLDARRYDAVLSSQPPSFATPHPRHLSVFFHHHRIFYDLEERYLTAGFSPDPELHRRASARVRELDRPRLDAVRWFLAGSEPVRARLARWNGIDRVGLFHAGPATGLLPGPAGGPRHGTGPPATRPEDRTGPVLCVGRLEFPKRPELFVQALHLTEGRRGVLAGDGGRMAWVRAVDERLGRHGADPASVPPEELWCTTGWDAPPTGAARPSPVEIAGRVPDERLARLYRDAPCVVAPAYEEDYGLTAVEAMRFGTPVVVCRDGGGLASLVRDGFDGLVVDPDGPSIAAAVERLCTDTDLRAQLSQGARTTASTFTWRRAADQLRAGLRTVFE